MRLKLLVFVSFLALGMSPVAFAAEAGCDHACACCEKMAMPCCSHEHTAPALAPTAAPARQSVTVWFHRPVWFGRNVLMGKYVIEHDNDRAARGEPCTHVYAAEDMTKPVVTFHCTHLDANKSEKTTVLLGSLPDGMRKFMQFQFAGESAAHGFPTER